MHIYAASRLHLARVLSDRLAKLRRDYCHRERLQSTVESLYPIGTLSTVPTVKRASCKKGLPSYSAHCKKGEGGTRAGRWPVPSPRVDTVGTVHTV